MMRVKANLFRLSGSNACRLYSHVLIILCSLWAISLLGHSIEIARGAGQEQNTGQNKQISKQKYDAYSPSKLELEIDKLKLEKKKLELEIDKPPQKNQEIIWEKVVPPVLSGVVGIVGALGGMIIARRQIVGARDQAVHEARLKAYPKLVKATAGFAIYFPDARQHVPISPKHCADMGKKLTEWYFDKGGFLLTEASKHAYFQLATALMRASRVESLKVPTLEDYGFFPKEEEPNRYLSKDKLDKYRTCLKDHYGLELGNVESWEFGSEELPAHREPDEKPNNNSNDSQTCSKDICEKGSKFKDYIFLQKLASNLRTQLIEDTTSRKPPFGKDVEKSISYWDLV